MSNQLLGDAIRASRTGDQDAFRQIFDHCHDKLFRYLLARTPSRDDALDLTQDTFVDLWQALPRFRYASDRQFFAFVFTIAKRKLAKYYAAAPRTVEFDEAHIAGSFSLDIEDYRQLTRSIASLSINYQEMLHLRYWGGLSWKETAATLGITEVAAKVWHHRALRKLQRTYHNETSA